MKAGVGGSVAAAPPFSRPTLTIYFRLCRALLWAGDVPKLGEWN